MTSILLTLLMSLAPAKADIKETIGRSISDVDAYCRLEITQARATGEIQLHCSSINKRQVEKMDAEDLIQVIGGTVQNEFVMSDVISDKRGEVFRLITSHGFRITPTSCEPMVVTPAPSAYMYRPSQNVEKVQPVRIELPTGYTRVCHYHR